MDLFASSTPFSGTRAGRLPARRIDAAGRARVDQWAVLGLALPLMASSSMQIVLNLTDMWFIGHISTQALAAVGIAQWLVVAVVLVLGGGVGSGVQPVVAQAQGSGRYRQASQAAWLALWRTLCIVPLFVIIGASGHVILAPFDLDPQVEQLATAFWMPRISGAAFGAAAWALAAFFNGISRPRMAVLVSVTTASANILFNALFIFHLGLGVAGSGWATTVAQAIGLLVAMAIFLGTDYRASYRSHLTWKPRGRRLLQQLRLSMAMGLLPAGDLLAFSCFQTMQVRLGTADGAATQMVMMLMSISYMPGYGISQAGTTLVGQSIGAGDRAWAMRVGNRVILLTSVYTSAISLLLAFAGPWILPLFTTTQDADAAGAMSLGAQLLWFAVGYQLFDGLNLSSALCLRGAGDVVFPVMLVLPVSFLVFLPLAHSLMFAPGQGWVSFLPQFGWGAYGGWAAAVLYLMLLGSVLFLRWRTGAWQKIRM